MPNDPIDYNESVHKHSDWKAPLYLFSLIILIISIFWIYQSPFFSTYSSDWGIFLALLGVAASLFMTMHSFNYYVGIAVVILFTIASYLLNTGDDDNANIGAWILILASIIPGIYMLYEGKWKKKNVQMEGFYLSIVSGLASAVLIGLSLTNVF